MPAIDIAKLFRLFTLQFASSRYIKLQVAMLLFLLVALLVTFGSLRLVIPGQVGASIEMQISSIQSLILNIPFGLGFVPLVIAEVVFGYQQKTYRSYLTQGFSRLELSIWQFINMVFTLLWMVLLTQVLVFLFGLYNMGSNAFMLFNGFYAMRWLALIQSLLVSGLLAVMLASLINSSFAFFAYIIWLVAEKLISGLADTEISRKIATYLPMQLNTAVYEQLPPDSNWYLAYLMLAIWACVFLASTVYWVQKKSF